jgi:hypothetical protein
MQTGYSEPRIPEAFEPLDRPFGPSDPRTRPGPTAQPLGTDLQHAAGSRPALRNGARTTIVAMTERTPGNPPSAIPGNEDSAPAGHERTIPPPDVDPAARGVDDHLVTPHPHGIGHQPTGGLDQGVDPEHLDSSSQGARTENVPDPDRPAPPPGDTEL